MILPGIKPLILQGQLWDEPLGGHGTVRTTLGEFVEELTAKLFGGRRFKTDSRADYCPDILFPKSIYGECKAAGRSNQTFVYAGRLARDRVFSATNELVYIIWHHAAETRRAATEAELKSLFLATMRDIYIVPFREIDRLASLTKEEALNSQYGKSGGSPFYGSGFRLSMKSIQAAECIRIEFKR